MVGPCLISGAAGVLVGLTLALPLAVAAQSPSPSAYPALADGEAWIAYQQPAFERRGAHAVHLVRPDGSGRFFAAAAVPGGEQLHPEFSPDGRSLALDADDGDGTYDLWIVDLSDGSARRVIDCVAPCAWAQEPAWSPDGTHLAFDRYIETDAGGTFSVEVLDLATGALEVVLQTGAETALGAPRWSPDGSALVVEMPEDIFGAFTGSALNILILTADPPKLQTLVEGDRFANNPDWSPDGTLIVFSAPAEGGEPGGALSDLWVIAPDGTGLRQLTDVAAGGGSAVHPTFTPDSTRVVFKLTDPSTGASDAMASIALDGTDLRPLVGDAWTFGYHPRLRPAP